MEDVDKSEQIYIGICLNPNFMGLKITEKFNSKNENFDTICFKELPKGEEDSIIQKIMINHKQKKIYLYTEQVYSSKKVSGYISKCKYAAGNIYIQ